MYLRSQIISFNYNNSPWPLYVYAGTKCNNKWTAASKLFHKNSIFMIKRTMLTSKARQLIFEGKPLLENSRNFATWLNYSRMAQKRNFPLVQYIKNINGETLKLMPSYNCSGKSYCNLIHKESGDTNPLSFKYYGTWTTSPSPYKGKTPKK